MNEQDKNGVNEWVCSLLNVPELLLVVVVQQKGQMVFKQIKQIANYSCYLSLIIGSFFILSLHISLRQNALHFCAILLFSLCTVLSAELHSLCSLAICAFLIYPCFRIVVVVCFLLIRFVSFIIYVSFFFVTCCAFGWGLALLAITSNQLKLLCSFFHSLSLSWSSFLSLSLPAHIHVFSSGIMRIGQSDIF